jgi:hypothetical protein
MCIYVLSFDIGLDQRWEWRPKVGIEIVTLPGSLCETIGCLLPMLTWSYQRSYNRRPWACHFNIKVISKLQELVWYHFDNT